MTSFLEYLLTQYLGPPTSQRGSGCSFWDCPVCGSSSFHTMPDKPQWPHRAKCWGSDCGLLEDAKGMLKQFHPDETYDERLDRLTHLQGTYQQQNRERGGSRFGARSTKRK